MHLLSHKWCDDLLNMAFVEAGVRSLSDKGKGEESPDTIGQDSFRKKGRFGHKSEATDSVTENIPPRRYSFKQLKTAAGCDVVRVKRRGKSPPLLRATKEA